MRIQVLENADLSPLENEVLKEGKLQIVPASVYARYPQEHLSLLCLKYGLYGLPTTELVIWLKAEIGNRRAIEIGSGNGVLAAALGIPATDNRMQEWADIATYYKLMHQTPVSYGDNVEKLDALDAIKKYKPDVVLASWVTQKFKPGDEEGNQWGIDEEEILQSVPMYIHIGNRITHGKKRVLKYLHKEYHFPWLYSRQTNQKENVIYVWKS